MINDESNDKTKVNKWKIIGCVIIIVLCLCTYPMWLWDTTRTAFKPEMTKLGTVNSYVLVSDNANMYCNPIIYKECDQGCEIINSHWAGKRNADGSLNCQLTMEMYFSTYMLQTDSIVPGNRLVLTLSNGDSIVMRARKLHAPKSIGSWRRAYSCHASRRSDYYPFSVKEIELLRTYDIVGVLIESEHDTLRKSLPKKKSEAVRKRFVCMTDELRRSDSE